MPVNGSRLTAPGITTTYSLHSQKSFTNSSTRKESGKQAYLAFFSHFCKRYMQVVKVMLFPTFFPPSEPFLEERYSLCSQATLEPFTSLSVCSWKGVPHIHNQVCIISYLKSCSQSLENSSLRSHCLLLFTPNLQEELGRRMVMLDTGLQCCSAVALPEVHFSGNFAFSITRSCNRPQ